MQVVASCMDAHILVLLKCWGSGGRASGMLLLEAVDPWPFFTKRIHSTPLIQPGQGGWAPKTRASFRTGKDMGSCNSAPIAFPKKSLI